MDSINQTSYFMLWLHEQNSPCVGKAPPLSPETPEKQIESPFTQDNMCEQINQKNQESKDKSETDSLKLCKKVKISII